MSNTTEHTNADLYIAKINGLVADGREDLIAAIVADYERGAAPAEVDAHSPSPSGDC
jgi:hypothetical protein